MDMQENFSQSVVAAADQRFLDSGGYRIVKIKYPGGLIPPSTSFGWIPLGKRKNKNIYGQHKEYKKMTYLWVWCMCLEGHACVLAIFFLNNTKWYAIILNNQWEWIAKSYAFKFFCVVYSSTKLQMGNKFNFINWISLQWILFIPIVNLLLVPWRQNMHI